MAMSVAYLQLTGGHVAEEYAYWAVAQRAHKARGWA